MATIRKRERKSGVIYDIQVKIKEPSTGKVVVKTTTWVPEGKMTPKQQERAVAVFADKYEADMRRMIVETTIPVDNHNITVREFGEQWLQKVKRDHSLNYYVKCKAVLEDVNQYIGVYKVRELTPAIIQKYYDNLDSRTKKTRIVTAKKNFKNVLESHGFTYLRLRYELNIQCCTLCAAYKQGNVSKRWADTLCKKTNIPFDALFLFIEEETAYAFATIDKYKRVVRAMLSKAKKARLIVDNYASADYIDFPKRPPREIHCMDDEEAKTFFKVLMDYPDIRIKTALLIFILTGFRRAEVAGLQWKDVDFEQETITIARSLTYNSDFGIILKEPKTETSKRRVTIAKTLVKVLMEYKVFWQNQVDMMGDIVPEGTDWIFIQANGKPVNPCTYIQWLKRVLQSANLEHHTLHSLRHTNITMQIAAGVPIVTVASRAGHARSSTTLDVYSHFIRSSDQMAAQTIDKLFTEVDSEE